VTSSKNGNSLVKRVLSAGREYFEQSASRELNKRIIVAYISIYFWKKNKFCREETEMVGPPLVLHQSCSKQLKQALEFDSLSSLGPVSVHIGLMQKFCPAHAYSQGLQTLKGRDP
jgi:hypothetical protein